MHSSVVGCVHLVAGKDLEVGCHSQIDEVGLGGPQNRTSPSARPVVASRVSVPHASHVLHQRETWPPIDVTGGRLPLALT